MPSKWRRFEVLVPLQSNEGADFPADLLGEAVFEVLDHFKGVSFENANITGHWFHEGAVYRDTLAKIVVDVPDNLPNRRWMKQFKARWKKRLDQLEIWMVSYRIDID